MLTYDTGISEVVFGNKDDVWDEIDRLRGQGLLLDIVAIDSKGVVQRPPYTRDMLPVLVEALTGPKGFSYLATLMEGANA